MSESTNPENDIQEWKYKIFN